MNYRLSKVADHVNVQINVTVKINVKADATKEEIEKEVLNFYAGVRNDLRMKSELVTFEPAHVKSVDRFCGSLREKLLHDAQTTKGDE